MSDSYGFSKTEIEGLRDKINTVAGSCAEDITNILEQRIVQPMSEKWYAGEAVEFFQEFKTVVGSTGTVIHEAFDNFRQAIQEAGSYWATNTKSEAETPVLATLDDVSLDLDVSSIKEKDESGRVIIHSVGAGAVANSLTDVENEINDTMNRHAQSLDASTAFIGGGQAEAISACFDAVSTAVSKIFKFLTTGEGSADGRSIAHYQGLL